MSRQALGHAWPPALLVAAQLLAGGTLQALEPPQASGYALLSGQTEAEGPLEAEELSTQLHLGLDWAPAPWLLAHVHLLARSDAGPSQDGHAGSPEAYLEASLAPGAERLRLRAGAFFLPTSRENVDALWENPYAISSSALNTWFGEELRPIGLDLTWRHGGALAGASLFRGNDTFGALPVDRGWALHDRWTLLGEKLSTGDDDFTSVSAENDQRLGWSARAGWNATSFALLYTHVDNRSDGLRYGDLYNWTTRFDLVGFDASSGDWSVAGEAGWGPTSLVARGRRFESDIWAGYLLVSRRLPFGRATARFEAFDDGQAEDQALTLALLFAGARHLGAALELTASGQAQRLRAQLRYGFSTP